MEVETAFLAGGGGEAFELVQEGEGPLDDVARLAQADTTGPRPGAALASAATGSTTAHSPSSTIPPA
jgi:hypothetical protein